MAGALRKTMVYLGLAEEDDGYDRYDDYDERRDQRAEQPVFALHSASRRSTAARRACGRTRPSRVRKTTRSSLAG